MYLKFEKGPGRGGGQLPNSCKTSKNNAPELTLVFEFRQRIFNTEEKVQKVPCK